MSNVPVIYTSRYQNQNGIIGSGGIAVGITVGTPRFKKRYEATYARNLAPERAWFELPRPEFETIYRAKLNDLGFSSIAAQLGDISEANGNRPLVLLCFEDITQEDEWCHREIFAEWWHKHSGQTVEELPELRGPTNQPARARSQQPETASLSSASAHLAELLRQLADDAHFSERDTAKSRVYEVDGQIAFSLYWESETFELNMGAITELAGPEEGRRLFATASLVTRKKLTSKYPNLPVMDLTDQWPDVVDALLVPFITALRSAGSGVGG